MGLRHSGGGICTRPFLPRLCDRPTYLPRRTHGQMLLVRGRLSVHDLQVVIVMTKSCRSHGLGGVSVGAPSVGLLPGRRGL